MVQTMTSPSASQNIQWKTLKLQNAASFCEPLLIKMLAIRNLFKVTWRFDPVTGRKMAEDMSALFLEILWTVM